jgi:copper oxidase (laccase) domain-containing protein
MAPKQVHGTVILDTSIKNTLTPEGDSPEADGILFDAWEAAGQGIEASLRFADCAPVVVSPSLQWVEHSGAPWVLMMHSGYKGTVLNVVTFGLEKVREHYGASALDGAWAWVGPCVSMPHYPRDPEEWTFRGLESFRKTNVQTQGEKVFFDIAEELRLQLTDAGITADRVSLSGIDTYERSDVCYSYRKGERTLRMFLWARSLTNNLFSRGAQ